MCYGSGSMSPPHCRAAFQSSIASLLCFLSFVIAAPARADDPPADRQHRMSYLDNGVIRLGVDPNLGGAITYLARSGSGDDQNLVNSWDCGRQIQMSYYGGPVPFTPDGKQPKPEWRALGWNPIQVGDAFGHRSRVTDVHNDGKRIDVKCVPLQWPLENVPGECTFECELALDGPVVHAHCRLVNRRADHRQYPGRGQELPAVYTNAPWYKLITYRGDRPFTNDALSRVEKNPKAIWSHWLGTESWAALVDDHDFGLGVFSPGRVEFTGGFYGRPGTGGPHDNSTGYIAPTGPEILDWNVEHEYRYDLIVGQLAAIRKYVYDHAVRPAPPAYRFEHDRQGWSYVNAVDMGWPVRNELNVLLEQDDPQLHGPVGFWQAADAGTLVIHATSHCVTADARVFWRTPDDAEFAERKSKGFTLISDGNSHSYRIELSESPVWKGAIVQLRLDPVASGGKGEWIRIQSIAFEK